MLILFRPGPYICGEWDLGGFPARLLSPPFSFLRTYSPSYISELTRWYSVLLPIIEPHLVNNGGNIAMVQVENEYGSFGDVTKNPNDEKYIRYLVTLTRKHLGPSVVLYTTDGGNYESMRRGSLPGSIVLTLGDYGPGTDLSIPADGQGKMNPPSSNPLMCTEYYTGWLTHYGEDIAVTSTQDLVGTLEVMIEGNVSFNLYMADGGTNFGFWAGANGGGGTDYQPDITSYDYNSPISESGVHNVGSDGGDKFGAIRDLMIEKFGDVPEEPPFRASIGYGDVVMSSVSSPLLSFLLSRPVVLTDKATKQEDMGQRFGLTAYAFGTGECEGCKVEIGGIADYANVYVDGVFVVSGFRADGDIALEVGKGQRVDVVVEGMGRINFSSGIYDRKGLGGIKVDGEEVGDVEHRFWEVEDVGGIEWGDREDGQGGSRLYRGTFEVDEGDAGSTFVDVSGFGKGMVFVNGFNLGRFWTEKGPVLTLWCPDEVVKEGTNEIVVMEVKEGGGEGGGEGVALVEGPQVAKQKA